MHAHAHGRLGGHSHSPKLTCGCVQSPVHRHVCTRIWGPIHSYTRVFACASVCICVHAQKCPNKKFTCLQPTFFCSFLLY